ncbi:testis-expressed protein 9 [Gouania willdenowi]|nr:testis-expressed protein 9 [Gouania willdenowi]
MADRGLEKKSTKIKKRPSSASKAEKPKKEESRQHGGRSSACGPVRTVTEELLAKEQHYKLLNAELEEKTADLVRQAEQLMREPDEVQSKPLLSKVLLSENDEDTKRESKPHQPPGVKKLQKRPTSQSTGHKKQEKEIHHKTAVIKKSHPDDSVASEESANLFLAKTIQSMEEKIQLNAAQDNVEDELDAGGSEAQTRVLKAKLRIMQVELDQLSTEYYKKDDENEKLSAKMKALEEDRDKLQRTSRIQQAQIDKHKASADDLDRKCHGLQLQVSTLHKEIENLNQTHKQAVAAQRTAEVRLNRALEEVEKLKSQLSNMKQMNKDKMSEEHQSKESLLAENTTLRKQKAELIVGFKKQLKLIDVLKRQKMHFEAAKLLSFKEEEFLNALDWGKS